MDPKTFFETRTITPQSGKCFVLMPFAERFDEVYDTIREIFESQATSFTCKRADDIRGGGHIMESVLQEIAEAEIVIADLTGSNPNVFYELGIAHMLKDTSKVILLTQAAESMPFDINSFRSIIYKQTPEGAAQLKIDLQNAINEVAGVIKFRGENNNTIYQFKVKEGEVFKFPVRLFGEGNCLYDFEIFGDYIGEDGVKFTLTPTMYIAGKPSQRLSADGYGLSRGSKREVPNIPWEISINDLAGRTVIFHLTHK